MDQHSPLIDLKKVSLKFGKQVVHKDINLSLYRGETLTILGPSGAGKTVILRLILGLLAPSSGDVLVFGKSIAELDEIELNELRRNIGMVFQGAALFDSLSVYENIAYPLRERGEENEDKISQTVHKNLALIGLAGIQDKLPSQLSGGQKKRVGLARALASEPCVMLFDEPTTGLDPTSVKLIDDLIIRLREEFGISSIAITHDIPSARRFSTRWALLSDGYIQANGAVSELENTNTMVREFVSGNWDNG